MLAVIFVIYFLIGSGVWILYEGSIRSIVNPYATPWKYIIFWPLFVFGLIKGWIDSHMN